MLIIDKYNYKSEAHYYELPGYANRQHVVSDESRLGFISKTNSARLEVEIDGKVKPVITVTYSTRFVIKGLNFLKWKRELERFVQTEDGTKISEIIERGFDVIHNPYTSQKILVINTRIEEALGHKIETKRSAVLSAIFESLLARNVTTFENYKKSEIFEFKKMGFFTKLFARHRMDIEFEGKIYYYKLQSPEPVAPVKSKIVPLPTSPWEEAMSSMRLFREPFERQERLDLKRSLAVLSIQDLTNYKICGVSHEHAEETLAEVQNNLKYNPDYYS